MQRAYREKLDFIRDAIREHRLFSFKKEEQIEEITGERGPIDDLLPGGSLGVGSRDRLVVLLDRPVVPSLPLGAALIVAIRLFGHANRKRGAKPRPHMP